MRKKGRRNGFQKRCKHWDKSKLKIALERVVFIWSKTSRQELTKVLDAGKVESDFNLGLKVIGGLTFGF